MKRPLKVAVAAALAATVGLTALIGFAHTKHGRPLLALLRGHGPSHDAASRCPFGFDKAQTAEQKEASRASFSRAHRGAVLVHARPALGFRLDATTEADVLAWARASGVSCKKPKAGYDLDCAGVPDSALPEAERGAGLQSLWLTFGGDGKLVTVVAVRKSADPRVVSDAFASVKEHVEHEAGAASSHDGEGSPEELASGPLYQASAEYRFKNYYALARATNMGDGFLLTEEYRSLTD
jgi:hypothetical protein